MAKSKPFFIEAIQFVPVITLASSFLVAGGVDLGRAAPLFVVSAAMAVIITVGLAAKQVLLNPILLGSNLWLFVGAIAFGLPVPPLADFIAFAEAAGLFGAILVVGIGYFVARSKTGFIGLPGGDAKVVRNLSIVLLALTALALGWSIVFLDNIRLAGGLPFILLNVTRRVLIRRSRRR